MDASSTGYFEREHRRMEAQLHAHLLHVVGADFERARTALQRWRRALARHIDIENHRLLPHLPEGARWPARLYLLEHQRIELLADEYAERLDALLARPLRSQRARRQAVLALLDAAHALRHLIEHHHQREEMALAHELPLAVQQAAWETARRSTAP